MIQAMPTGSTGVQPLFWDLPAGTPARGRPGGAGRGLLRGARLGARRGGGLAVLLVLAGCATGVSESNWWNPAGIGPAPTSPPPATNVVLPVRAADPLAAFAARAQSGQTESVATADGQLVTARMVRAYNAASGRECRELQFGGAAAPGGAPGATYCNDPAQGWVAARALLRGGAVYRP